MSTTNDWDFVAGVTQPLLSSLRAYIFSQIIPPTFTVTYDGETVTLVLNPAAASITVDTSAENTLNLQSPFTGTVGSDAVQGTVSMSVDLANMALNDIAQPAYLQMDGNASEYGYGGQLDTFTSSAGTLEAWVKTDATNKQTLVEFGPDGSGGAIPRLSVSDSVLGIYWGTSSTGQDYSSTDTAIVCDGQWHHVATVFDGDTITYYKDGQAKDSVEMPSETSANTIQFGSYFGSASALNGDLTQVRVWNVARSAQEIQQYLNVELSGDEDGLLGYWNFADGTVTNLVNGTNGSVTGGASIVVDADDTLDWTFYINFWKTAAFSTPVVDLTKGSDDDADTLTGLFTQSVQDFTLQPYDVGQVDLSTSLNPVIPTTSNFITIPNADDGDASQLMVLMMAANVLQPSGDASDYSSQFASDSTLIIPDGSNFEVAIEDYWFMETVIVPQLATALDVSTSDFDVSQDPAVVTLNTDVKLPDNDQNATMTKCTVEFDNGGLSIDMKIEVSYFVIEFSGTLTVTPVDNGDGTESFTVAFTDPTVELSWNQDNSTVQAIETAFNYYLEYLLGIGLGLILQAIYNWLEALPDKISGEIQDKIDSKDLSTTLGPVSTSQVDITEIVMDGGIVVIGELTVPSPSTSTDVLAAS